MENQFKKATGISLLTGGVLATITMAMHPVGGSLAEIATRKETFIFTHSLALISIPFIAFGFWGLATALLTKSRISFLSFAISCFALVAVMAAGTLMALYYLCLLQTTLAVQLMDLFCKQ